MKKIWSQSSIKTLIITIVINFFLFAFKLLAGIIGHSNAMVSDAIHSLSDVLTTIIVIIGIIISSKDADAKHQYGHERIESIFAIVLAFFLLITGLSIGFMGINCIIENVTNPIKIPGIVTLIAALVSIIVKEIMFHYTMHVAKKVNSESMKADAWHHRSDAMSSIGSLIGIIGSRLGLPMLDPICSVIICLIIIKTSLEIFINSVKGLIDESCDEELKEKIIDIIRDYSDVIDIGDIKTRLFGNKIYIDADIKMSADKTLKEANNTVIQIHDKIENKFKVVKHCNIHVLPE